MDRSFRIVFTALCILMLLTISLVKSEKKDVLTEGECLRDYTFVWTEKANTFFVNHTPWKDFFIIQSSVGIDFMMISFLVIYTWKGTTLRIICALALFYPTRNVI